MFAFGIYDFRDDRLFLARGRFGIKPLFLAEIDGRLVFSSSLPALLKYPRISKAPNLPAISHCLTTFRITLGRETVFSGIWLLMPAELLYWCSGKIHVENTGTTPTTKITRSISPTLPNSYAAAWKIRFDAA